MRVTPTHQVCQFESGNVLTLGVETIRRARTSPVLAGIVGKVEPVFVPATTLSLLLGSTRTLPGA